MNDLLYKIKRQTQGTLVLWRYLVYRAYLRLQVIHNKSVIGFLWEPLMIIIMTIILSVVWSQVLKEQDFYSYFIYLIVGFSVWYYISSLVSVGTNIFYLRAKRISKSAYPLLSYPIEEVIRYSLSFALILPILFIVVSLLGPGFGLTNIFFLISGIFLIMLSGLGFALSVGTIVFFFGDFGKVVKAIMRVAFMATPILWHPDRLGEYEYLLVLNPFYSYIHFCRDGFLNGVVEPGFALVVILQTLILLFIGITFLALFGDAIKKRAFEL